MPQKPSVPKGTRDFSPAEVFRRRYIIRTLEEKFQCYGYAPVETPSFENLATLTGKYGAEGDRLIFKILNSGDFLSKADAQAFAQGDARAFANSIADKALRYDLTVPFARYVVQNQSALSFPFKRYQIQPVWRADRPQRGRFREFYQCDADVVGSASPWQEVELIQLYDAVFHALRLPVTIRLNNRKLLAGLAEVLGISDRFVDLTTALDKLDKIGVEGVVEALRSLAIPQSAIDVSMPLFAADNRSNQEKLQALERLLQPSEVGRCGLAELRFVLEKVESYGLRGSSLLLDFSLARGLDYYTGAIFEVSVPGLGLGSLGGGGRYDDLTAIFGLEGVPGVGISFGLDRISLALAAEALFPDERMDPRVLLFLNFGGAEADYAYRLVRALRQRGVACEFYPDAVKLKKQLAYAHRDGIPYVAMAGSRELASQTVSLKNMQTGEQQTLSADDFLSRFASAAQSR